MLPLYDDIPSTRRPVVTWSLMAINILVFLGGVISGQGQEVWAWKYGLVPFELTSGAEVTPNWASSSVLNIFTSMFLHGDFMHLGGNMLYLYIFGDNVEDRLGHVRFFVFYVLSGIAATTFFVWTSPDLKIPLVGASGAIAGVLGAYLISFPKARIATLIFFGFFIRVVFIPALFVLGFWFVLQILSGLPTVGSQAQTGGVAFMAHAGGFVTGMILIWLMRPGRPKPWLGP
jgi:membrane associated rhomboid family serine protease